MSLFNNLLLTIVLGFAALGIVAFVIIVIVKVIGSIIDKIEFKKRFNASDFDLYSWKKLARLRRLKWKKS